MECWNECLKQSNYDERMKQVEEFNARSKDVKKGLVIIPMKFAITLCMKFMHQGHALVR